MGQVNSEILSKMEVSRQLLRGLNKYEIISNKFGTCKNNFGWNAFSRYLKQFL